MRKKLTDLKLHIDRIILEEITSDASESIMNIVNKNLKIFGIGESDEKQIYANLIHPTKKMDDKLLGSVEHYATQMPNRLVIESFANDILAAIEYAGQLVEGEG